jgi:hypothetical protein
VVLSDPSVYSGLSGLISNSHGNMGCGFQEWILKEKNKNVRPVLLPDKPGREMFFTWNYYFRCLLKKRTECPENIFCFASSG